MKKVDVRTAVMIGSWRWRKRGKRKKMVMAAVVQEILSPELAGRDEDDPTLRRRSSPQIWISGHLSPS